MNKLTYEKFRNMDNIITIDLHNGYTIVAISAWQKEAHNYDVQLMLKENTIDKWDLIEKTVHLTFNTNYKYIHSAILKQVATYLEEGFFDHYVQRFEYELKCFDKGNEIFESERILNAKSK